MIVAVALGQACGMVAVAGVPTAPSIVYTVPGDRRIFVCDRNEDGTLGQPFALTAKGVNWSPASTNANPSVDTNGFRNEFFTWYTNDIPLMAGMGVNTVRLYHDPGTNAQARAVMDFLYAHGIKVIMPVDSPYYGSEANSNNIPVVVNAWKNHPALLMWGIGNEWDLSLYGGRFASLSNAAHFTEVAAQVVRSLDTNHPVATFIADPHIPGVHYLSPAYAPWIAAPFTSDLVSNWVPSVAVWGLQVYRGASFSDVFSQWAGISRKPVLISEFGADACDHRTNAENQAMQRSFDEGLWDEIQFALASERTNGTVSGGLLFEACDEWWKNGGAGVHNVSSEANPGQPDGTNDEEWFGMTDILRHPRAAYTGMQARFAWNGYQLASAYSNPSLSVISGPGATFQINGKTVFSRGGGDAGGRGINVAVLDDHAGSRMEDFAHFDTWYMAGYWGGPHVFFPALVPYLTNIPDGKIVLLAVADDGGFRAGPGGGIWSDSYVTQGIQALQSLGSTLVTSTPYTGGWAMITRKGVGRLAEAYSSGGAYTSIQATVSLSLNPDYGRRAISSTVQPARITSVVKTGGYATVTFQTQDAAVHAIDYCNSLRGSGWKVARRGVVADGTNVVWTDDGAFTGSGGSDTQRYYRLSTVDRNCR